jgi:virginiamycin B lyase
MRSVSVFCAMLVSCSSRTPLMPANGAQSAFGVVADRAAGVDSAGARWRMRYKKGVTYAGVALGPDGDIWMCDGGFGTTLDRFPPHGPVQKYQLGYHPEQITVGADGAFWLTANGSRILRVTTTGNITAYHVSDYLVGGIVTGGDANVWFVEQFHIGRITPSGELKEFPLTIGSQQFETIGETGIAWGPDGHLWFGAFASGYFILNLDPASGAIHTVASDDISGGPVIAGPDGNIWYTDGGTRSYETLLVKLTVAGHATTYQGPQGFIQSGTPQGMIVGPNDTLWFVTQHVSGGRVIGGGLVRYDIHNHRFLAIASPQGYEWQWAPAFDKASNVWMSANNQAQILVQR